MRVPRVFSPGYVHHVIARLVDHRFELDREGARARYLSLLGKAISKSDWRCIAYALMSSHVHLLTIAGNERPEHVWRRVHSPFGNWLNNTFGGLGPVFAERPKLIIVEASKVTDVLAYIHNNPVRAGVVPTASESDWTSHRAYLGMEPAPWWLDLDEGRRRIGEPSASELDAFVRSHVDAPDPLEEVDALGERLRRRAHRVGATLATPVYGDLVRVELVSRVHGVVRPDPSTVIATVCYCAKVDPQLVLERGENEIRRLVLVVGRQFGLSFAEMSSAMGFTRQYGQKLAEDVSNIDLVSFERARALLRTGQWVRKVVEIDSVPKQVPTKIAEKRRR